MSQRTLALNYHLKQRKKFVCLFVCWWTPGAGGKVSQFAPGWLSREGIISAVVLILCLTVLLSPSFYFFGGYLGFAVVQ